MAKKKTQHGSTKRFGPRYGRTVKNKLGKIEAEQKKNHRCPVCRYVSVTHLSAGIWLCGKCKAKFASRAYSVAKTSMVKG